MSKKSEILFPLITLAGRQVLPHYVDGLGSVKSGDETVQLALSRGFNASIPHPPHLIAKPTEWVERPLWFGNLSVVSYHGGRSSSCYEVHISRRDALSIAGLMSCLQFIDLIPFIVAGRVVDTTFTAVKRGQNYMIQTLEAK